MRWIDADHLKETLDYYIREAGWSDEINMALGWVKDEFIDSELSMEIICCRDCEYWKRQTAYNGQLLSFGFCESDEMWRSLYGETTEVEHIDTEDRFYCGYARRRSDG